jgi:ADP-ribose pyrophosphatase
VSKIPRGAIEPDQSPEQTARGEIEEEIGGRVRSLAGLGFLHGTTNLYASGAHLFFAEIESVGAPQIGEGITAVEGSTYSESLL